MRYLTFLIEGVRLGIKVDSVDSVGKGKQELKTGSGSTVKTIALGKELGVVDSGKTEPTVINCRIGGDTYQLLVDKVLDLDNVGEKDFHAWPPSLRFLKVYNGIILSGKQLFFSLDLERLANKKNR